MTFSQTYKNIVVLHRGIISTEMWFPACHSFVCKYRDIVPKIPFLCVHTVTLTMKAMKYVK